MKKAILILAVLISNFSKAQWQQENVDTSGTINALAVKDTTIFAGDAGGGGVIVSSNYGNTWTAENNGLSDTSVASLAISGSNIFCGTFGGMFLSTNNGSSWTSRNNGLMNSALCITINGASIFAGTSIFGVFLSTNNGNSWSAVNNGLNYTGIHSLASYGVNVFAATDSGVFLSTNNGSSWMGANNGLNPNVGPIAILGSNIFAGTLGGPYLSTNNGGSWLQINNGFTSNGVEAFAFYGSNVFAAGTFDIFLSSNNGSSWTNVSNGMVPGYIRSLAVCGPYLFAGTSGNGIWRRPLSEMVGIEEIAENYDLSIYPNPNNGKFVVYQNNKNISKSIAIMDYSGKTIWQTQNNLNQEPNIDISTQPKGVYFVKVMAGGKMEVKKVVIM